METVKMSIQEKMLYIQQALELGADVQLNFHNINQEEEAEQVAEKLSILTNIPFQKSQRNKTRWFRLDDYENGFQTCIFYDDDESFMEEDVILNGGEE